MENERLRLFLSKKIRGFLAGEHASLQFSTRGFDLEEKRRFRLGDDPRAIDLVSSLKKRDQQNTLKVSIKRIDKGANISFLIDGSRSVRFGTVNHHAANKYQYALRLARVISIACLGAGNRFRFMVFGEEIIHDSSLLMSSNSIEESLDTMEKMDPGSASQKLSIAIRQMREANNESSINSPGIIFVLSDFLFEDDFLSSLREASQDKDIVVMALADPAELKLPRRKFGLTRLVDPETGKTVLARMVSDKLDTLALNLKRFEIDLLRIDVSIPTGKILENLINLFENKREE